jgi:hypothetical protein
MARQHQGSYRLMFGSFKTVQGRKKWHMLLEEVSE